VRELFDAGVARVSTGSALAAVAQDALIQAARELQDPGTHGFWSNAIRSMGAVKAAFRTD
jgi:2-methylisocitrate lyase-like PEP mutase family enzyme